MGETGTRLANIELKARVPDLRHGEAVCRRLGARLICVETQTDTYFSREISDRVRVVACLTTLPNLIHSDSPSDTLSSSEWLSVRKATGATDDDTVVVVWGPPGDMGTAASEVTLRAREATIGIPSETRQALRDGTNGFERILPGPDRMYPDTDLPPLRITTERLERIRSRAGEPYWERDARYRQLGVPEDLRVPLAISPFAGLFREAVLSWALDPTLVAVCLIHLPKRVARVLGAPFDYSQESMREILHALRDGELTREGVLPCLLAAAGAGGFDRTMLPGPCSDAELSEIIADAARQLASLRLRHPDNARHVLMGLVMDRVRGRIDGKTVADRLPDIIPEITR